jgi:hypothetical protein
MQQVATRIGALLTAGGGTGPAPGAIPTCGTGAGGVTGAGGATGVGGRGGSVTGTANNNGADASVDGRRPFESSGGGWCQVGGAGANASGVAFALMAWFAARRRVGRSRRR